MTYASEVAADTPWAYWKLGEASGSFIDSSGNGFTGDVQTAGVELRSQAPLGAGLGNSTDLNGTYIHAVGNPGGGSVSIEWVFRPSNLVGGTPRGVIDFNNEARMIRISDASQPAGAFQIKLASGTTTLTTSGGLVANGNTYHCVVTYNTTTGAVLLYVNGTQVYSGTAATGGFVTGSGFLRFPWNNSNGREIKGPFSDFAIYQSVLSPTRVTAHFNAAAIAVGGTASLSQTSLLVADGTRTKLGAAALTQTSVLSGTAGTATTTALTQTSVLSATASGAVTRTGAAALSQPSVLSSAALIVVQVALGPWVADESRGAGFALDTSIALSVTEVEDPMAASAPPRQRVSETYPDPVLVNGRPT